MNGAVARKTEAGEILERIVRRVFVDVVDVYRGIGRFSTARLATAMGVFPSLPRANAVFRNKATALLAIIGRVTLRRAAKGLAVCLVAALPNYSSASVVGAELAANHSWSAAFDAQTRAFALCPNRLHARPIGDETVFAHGPAEFNGLATAGAFASRLTRNHVNGVFVNVEMARDGSSVAKLGQEGEYAFFIDHGCSLRECVHKTYGVHVGRGQQMIGLAPIVC